MQVQVDERCALTRCVLHLSKGRHVLWGCVSLLLNMHKKYCQQNILHVITPCTNMEVAICARVPPACAQVAPHVGARGANVQDMLLEIFEASGLSWV
jgi:hypothetical protein